MSTDDRITPAAEFPSRRVKESIKTALAMVIAYGIALQMNWDNPYWAGFAVAFISLASIGQSLTKGAMRMLGTVIAMLVGLTLIALFAQERWLFMVFLSAWVGFCTYMMGGPRRQYFWNVCGFVAIIICMDSGPDPVNAFETAVLRAEETGLGILVYGLVALLLWPNSSRARFDAAVSASASARRRLLRAYFALMQGEDIAADAQALRAQAMQAQDHFNQLLDAAEADSYEVWESRQQWRRYQQRSIELAQATEGWREGLADLRALDLNAVLPGLAACAAELDQRFSDAERMLAGEAATRPPSSLDLSADAARMRSLSPFQLAAVAVTLDRLHALDSLSAELLDCIPAIRGPAISSTASKQLKDGPPIAPRAPFLPDLDRLNSVVRIVVILWLAYLALIYVDALPGEAGFVTMAGSLGMALATAPQVAVSRLFVPAMVSTLFAALVYIFVMPLLSGFVELGLLLFVATYAICYLFAAPQQALGRVFGLAMFVTVTAISNEQNYSFLAVATTVLMFPLVFLLLVISAYIPISLRPERVVLHLLGRFFRSCTFLVANLEWQAPQERRWCDGWRRLFHEREVSVLPHKLAIWAKVVDTRALPGTSPEQVQALMSSVESLSKRMPGLLEVHHGGAAVLLARELLEDISAWHRLMLNTCQGLSADPSLAERETFREGLDRILEHIETRMRETVDKASEGQFSMEDRESFFRLLGALRNVSEGLVDYAGRADVIDWARWREERFA